MASLKVLDSDAYGTDRWKASWLLRKSCRKSPSPQQWLKVQYSTVLGREADSTKRGQKPFKVTSILINLVGNGMSDDPYIQSCPDLQYSSHLFARHQHWSESVDSVTKCS